MLSDTGSVPDQITHQICTPRDVVNNAARESCIPYSFHSHLNARRTDMTWRVADDTPAPRVIMQLNKSHQPTLGICICGNSIRGREQFNLPALEPRSGRFSWRFPPVCKCPGNGSLGRRVLALSVGLKWMWFVFFVVSSSQPAPHHDWDTLCTIVRL